MSPNTEQGTVATCVRWGGICSD